MPFFVLAGAVVLLIPAIVRLDLTGMTVHRESTTPVRTLIRRPFVIRAALLYLAMILPSGVYDVLWAKLLSDRGASLTLIGLSFTIYGIPYVAFAIFGSHLIDRTGAIRASVIGLVATLPPVILYGYIAAPIGLVLVATIEGVANAFSIPASQSAMVEACRPEEIGTGQGISGAAGIGAAGVAAVIAAPLYDSFGAAPTFVATAVTMATILADRAPRGSARGDDLLAGRLRRRVRRLVGRAETRERRTLIARLGERTTQEAPGRLEQRSHVVERHDRFGFGLARRRRGFELGHWLRRRFRFDLHHEIDLDLRLGLRLDRRVRQRFGLGAERCFEHRLRFGLPARLELGIGHGDDRGVVLERELERRLVEPTPATPGLALRSRGCS